MSIKKYLRFRYILPFIYILLTAVFYISLKVEWFLPFLNECTPSPGGFISICFPPALIGIFLINAPIVFLGGMLPELSATVPPFLRDSVLGAILLVLLMTTFYFVLGLIIDKVLEVIWRILKPKLGMVSDKSVIKTEEFHDY